MNDLCLVETVDGLGQGVVIGIANAANRGFDPTIGQCDPFCRVEFSVLNEGFSEKHMVTFWGYYRATNIIAEFIYIKKAFHKLSN